MSKGNRSQAYTLEGVIGSIFVLTALFFGLQVVDIGPWTSDQFDQTSKLKGQAQDVLDISANEGSLSRVVRCYGVGRRSSFDGATLGTNASKRTTFERLLNQTFDEQGNDYVIYFKYWNASGGEERTVVTVNRESRGGSNDVPSDAAAVATRTVAIYDNQTTQINGTSERDCADPGSTIKEYQNQTGQFYQSSGGMDDIAADSPLYNIVEVRILVW